MNDRLATDLGRWERGELRSDELNRRYPGGETAELLATHAWMSLEMSESDEEPALTWDELEARLDIDLDAEAERDREIARRIRRVPFIKLAAAFIAGALANPVSPAGQGLDTVRAVAQKTAEVVVAEVTEVFDPIVPPANTGVVVLHPIEEEKASAVSPAVPVPTADDPATSSGVITPDPAPGPTVPTDDVVVDDPVVDDREANGPATDDSTDTTDSTGVTEPLAGSDDADTPTATEPSPEQEPDPVPGNEDAASKPPWPSHARSGAAESWTPPGQVNKPAHAPKGGLAAAVAASESTQRPGPPSDPSGHAKGHRR